MFTNLNSKLKTKKKSSNRPSRRILSLVFIFLILDLVIPGAFLFMGAKQLSSHSKALVASYQAQDFATIRSELSATKTSLMQVDIPLNFWFWLQIIPFIGGYWQDAKGFSSAGVEELTALETIMQKLEPQKAELGFNNQPIAGQDRVVQAVKLLDKALPYLDLAKDNFRQAADKVKNIDTRKYPEKFKNIALRRQLEMTKDLIIGSSVAVSEGKAALEQAPQALGVTSPKNYLLLFQNDKEIRPTGGFITAYANLMLDKGKVNSTTSDDIYRLDEKLLNVCLSKICPLTPPEPIVKYLPEVSGKTRSAWSMRDSNISPDLLTSAKEFERMYQLLGEGLPYDGIIYIDSQVVEQLIEVTGPIDIFGTSYSAEVDKRCNCPGVIYELESYAEIAAKGAQDRKAILGVLMQQILARSIGANVEKLPLLISTLAELANQKHILLYMHDPKLEQALSLLNWTGEIKGFDGDYLHINDSNFAGGKSNLYVEQIVSQDIFKKDGLYHKKITIDYKNPQPFGNWLNGINRDYVRFYVPKGSKLLSAKGSEVNVTTIEDLDKTVFEAFITVRPQNSRRLEIEYTIPYQPKDKYQLMIQKQPGAKDFEYKIRLNGRAVADFTLVADQTFSFSQ